MKISDLRDWASREFGAHSHKEGQVHAALGPLAESLDQLAKQGVNLEVVTAEDAAKVTSSPMKALHEVDEPPTPMNSGGTSEAGVDVVEIPMPEALVPEVHPDDDSAAPEAPKLDTNTFVDDTGFATEGAPK